MQVSAGSPPDAALDVVFVHGLGGDNESTWHWGDNRPEHWGQQLSHEIPELAVWSLGYPAEATKWTSAGPGMELSDRARSIIDYLLAHGIGLRPLVFVAHSLGGLVVKQVLRLAAEMKNPTWTPLWTHTRGVAFLATPHAGTRLTKLGDALKLLRLTDIALDLGAHSPHLRDLGDWYRQNVPDQGISTVAYGELRKIRKLGSLVVDQTSADPGVRGCLLVPTDEDHFSISKPTSAAAPVYVGVKRLIEEAVADLTDSMGILKLEADPERVPTRSEITATLAATAAGSVADRTARMHDLVRSVRISMRPALTFRRLEPLLIESAELLDEDVSFEYASYHVSYIVKPNGDTTSITSATLVNKGSHDLLFCRQQIGGNPLGSHEVDIFTEDPIRGASYLKTEQWTLAPRGSEALDYALVWIYLWPPVQPSKTADFRMRYCWPRQNPELANGPECKFGWLFPRRPVGNFSYSIILDSDFGRSSAMGWSLLEGLTLDPAQGPVAHESWLIAGSETRVDAAQHLRLDLFPGTLPDVPPRTPSIAEQAEAERALELAGLTECPASRR